MRNLVLGWPGVVIGCIGAIGMVLTLHSRWFVLFCLLVLVESSLGLWFRFGNHRVG
jgi:hypothetical protein